MTHIQVSHVRNTIESCHKYKWVLSNIKVGYVKYTKESCQTYKWVMSHIQESHVKYTNESCHKYKHHSLLLPGHDTCEWVMSNIQMSHNSSSSSNTRKQPANNMSDLLSHSFVTRLYVWHDSSDLFAHKSAYKSDMSHTRTRHTRTRHTRTSHVTLVNESCPTYQWVTTHPVAATPANKSVQHRQTSQSCRTRERVARYTRWTSHMVI